MRAVLLPIHVTGGGLAIVLGALALLVVKGGSLHRKSGILFVYAMGVPAPMILFLGTIIALAAVGDVRVIRRGPLHGAARLKRHLWRMCFALFIAAGSFFSIRSRVAKVLPEPFLSAPPRILLILLPFVPMFYWLWRLGHSNHISRNKPIPS